MNQEEIGKIIKDLRKKNNLTQEKFAQLLNVTYQAVSKWETGKSMPDISTLKLISEKFNIDIDDILKGNTKKKQKIIYLIIALLIVVIIMVGVFFAINKKHSDFDFKTISTSCNEFTITGSAAYSKDKGFIYISDVEYCGKENVKTYDEISCFLYEKYDNNMTKISDCQKQENVSLSDYLNTVKVNVNNYSSICKNMENVNLILIIKAVDKDNVTTTYDIPLTLENNC